MARRSSRIQEVHEKNELSCMWGLFSIIESCQGPANRNIIDYPRPLDTIASFDEECRKIHNGGSGVQVDDKGRSVRSCIGDDMPVEQHQSQREIVKRLKMDAELVDRLKKTHKRTRKRSQDVYQSSSSCCLNNAARLMNELPSTSAEKSLNKLTLAAILGAVCAQQQEIKLSEYLQGNSYLGKYDEVDEINIQQVQMRAKAFVDQIYTDRKFILREGRNSDSKSFSNALEVLNSKRDLFMQDPDSMLARRSKKMNPSQTEKDTIKSVLSGYASEYEDSTSAKFGNMLAMHEVNMTDDLWQNIDYQLEYSSKTSFTAQPSDKIVILKPAPRNEKHSGNLICNCSALQFPSKSSRIVSEEKTASFSFREIKRKLKHTFRVAKKETSQLSQECICDGNFSTNGEKEGKVLKKQELKSSKGYDIACGTDSTRRKLYFSSAKSSNKQECDVLLEAKKHLSTRLNNLNSLEAVASKKSPRTLERILSSPEHEFWPFSPRRDSLYRSSSAEMRFSPYNTSPRATESSSCVRNELRSNTEVVSLQTVDAKAYSVILRTEAECRDTNIFTADKMKLHGESKIAETDSFPQPESHVSGEVLSETTSTSITKPSETTDIIKAQKCDGIVMASLAENEAVTSTLDDFPSTPSNGHHIEMAENNKFQEEHQSPVSVLEQFYVEDSNSPPTITLQTGQFSARKQLQPHCLDFKECSFESSPQYAPATAHFRMEEELYQYVQSVMETSSLNWDQLSELSCQPEELLHESLFDEVELPPLDCYYHPKLLFDHINEVLLEIYKCHFCSPPWLASATAKIRSAPLPEVVLDEILAEADYFLLPTSERTSLDELVSEDAKCRSWLDVQLDTEHVVIEVAEAVLEESLLDTLLEFHT